MRPEQDKVITGLIDVVVKYGRINRVKYKFNQKNKVSLRFYAQNNITYWDWIDL